MSHGEKHLVPFVTICMNALVAVVRRSCNYANDYVCLRRWHDLECLRNLLLPRQAVLAKDLRTRLEVLDAFVQQSCP